MINKHFIFFLKERSLALNKDYKQLFYFGVNKIIVDIGLGFWKRFTENVIPRMELIVNCMKLTEGSLFWSKVMWGRRDGSPESLSLGSQ